MPLFIINDKVVFFTHIPKTGGSSVEAAIRSLGARQALLKSSSGGFMKCTPQHIHAEIIEVMFTENFFDLNFTVCRNPVDRLVSEYKMRMSNREKKIPFEKFIDNAFARYEQNPFFHDNHIRPQHQFLTRNTKVFKFEDGLKPALDTLCETVGVPPISDIPHTRKGASDPVNIPRRTLDKIKDFYEKDFATFGYEMPEPVGT